MSLKSGWTCSLCCAALLSFTGPSVAREPISLFDGHSLNGWTTLDGQPVTRGWEAVDGALHLNVGQGRGGHIITDREYSDFDLRFEWRIASGGNSGVKYRVRRFGNKVLGCEFQILDDTRHRDGGSSKKSTGSLYDVYPPNAAKYLRPREEYNHSRIVVSGNRLEHWLNGRPILVAYVGSCEWYRRKADSKFADVAGFGENRFGKIMLTDHNSEVWYRNITLRPLPSVTAGYAAASSGRRRPAGGFFRRRFRRCR